MESELVTDYQHSPSFAVTDNVKAAFDHHGYIIVRNLLTSAEVTKLRAALDDPEGVLSRQYDVDDGHGKVVKMAMWAHPGNDITGIIARSEKVAGTFEKLLGGEVYHFHGKIALKKPRSGGAHLWHQDYGYWYKFGLVFPNMGTVFIAVDEMTNANGCLQVIAGSNRAGRIDHTIMGDQAGADPDRISKVLKLCDKVYCEMAPGDALFFHSNTLHHSEQNHSDKRRMALITAFNRVDNNPVDYIHSYEHTYTPLHKVPDSAILECDNYTDLGGKDFCTISTLHTALSNIDTKP